MTQRLAERVARLQRLIEARQGVVHVVLRTPWRTPTVPVRHAEAKAPAPRRVVKRKTKQ
jgi:hypothetical protein